MNADNNTDNLLTRIHGTYTLLDTVEAEYSQSDQLVIDNFLHTLAQIAISIAARNKTHEQQSGKQI
jgi:hypothetical protein